MKHMILDDLSSSQMPKENTCKRLEKSGCKSGKQGVENRVQTRKEETIINSKKLLTEIKETFDLDKLNKKSAKKDFITGSWRRVTTKLPPHMDQDIPQCWWIWKG
ncbi:hypothetical protein KEM48_000611 [Puccinia striiformis f. sp. tritici PST-130]|nr:hypothetical protein KEM48_000611 [Puccinia striiformis f. sp. tritici PST-130]